MAENEKAKDITSGLDGVKEVVKEILNPIDTVVRAVESMVTHSNALNKNFGLARARIIEMNNAFADSAPGIIKLGGSLGDVVKTITDIAAASNRNVIENEKVVSELYASSKVLDIESKTLVKNFKDIGYETSQIGPNLGESIEYIQSVGLNATQVMKDVSNNMEKMNRYQFDGGVAGLAKMAAQASMLRFDMAQTFSFADKMLTPENAINMASAFQRLGVTAGNLVDPFVLMNESINDPTGLQNSLARLGQEFTYFDEKTQSFKINPQGVLTLRQMEEEAGLAAGSLSKSALAAADLDKRLSTVSAAGLKFENEEDKQYLANIANMGKGGKYEVTLNDGTKKELQNLNQEEFDELIEQQKNAPKTVEDIQRSQLSLLDSIAGDMKAIVAAGKFGSASAIDVTRNMEGLRNVITKFADVSQKSIPKTPEIRDSVEESIKKMKSLVEDFNSGKMTTADIFSKIQNVQDNLLSKGKSLGQESYMAIQNILKETANSVKGGSDFEKWFKNSLSSVNPKTSIDNLSGISGTKKSKPLSANQVFRDRNIQTSNAMPTSKTTNVNSQVDVGGTITFKFDLPPGTTLNQKQLNDAFNSQEFKQYIVNLTKSNTEGKNQGVVSYGK